MMASDKVENIPRDRPRGDQLHRTVRDLQQTLLRVLPLLIEKLNPGTLGK